MAASPPAPDLRYPVGAPDRFPSADDRPGHLEALRTLPENFAEAFRGLHAAQLDTAYRTGGWTLRQVAHHVADSHMNAFVRAKLAMTEDWPTIKPYDEALWAGTADARLPIAGSLALLVPLHARMSVLLASLGDEAWEQRGYVHPENGRTSLAQLLALYSWHGRHHTAHVLGLRARMGW